MKLYVAGPMRGYEDFNFPAFFAAAKALREQGHEVFNPAERDVNHYGKDINKSATGDLADVPQFNLREALGADLAWICEHADGIALLPGWMDSDGACAEAMTGLALGLTVQTVDEWIDAP